MEKLYICVSLHEATSDDDGFPSLYEERMSLMYAQSKEEAKKKAEHLLTNACHSYRNDKGALITWTGRRIIDVVEMADDRIFDGAELYGRFFSDLEAYDGFLSLVRRGN